MLRILSHIRKDKNNSI